MGSNNRWDRTNARNMQILTVAHNDPLITSVGTHLSHIAASLVMSEVAYMSVHHSVSCESASEVAVNALIRPSPLAFFKSLPSS